VIDSLQVNNLCWFQARPDSPSGSLFLTMLNERLDLMREAGIPLHPQGTLDGPVGRDPHNRLKYAITAEGKPAVTHYALRERLRNASELSFRLETGRTHQIRVHMAALGHPVINDPVYGKSEPRFPLPGPAMPAMCRNALERLYGANGMPRSSVNTNPGSVQSAFHTSGLSNGSRASCSINAHGR